MHWDQATAAAARFAQEWTPEAGPGGAILLFDTDDIRAEACGGLASLEHGTGFSADAAVRYASVSKHFLAGLVVSGAPFGLDARLGDLLNVNAALADVTVARMLDMTAGLPDVMQTLWLLGVPPTASLDRAALLRFACDLPGLNFSAGSEVSYSNTGYRLVQAALEARGVDYTATLRERFFRPLGVGITLPEDETDPVPNLAAGYWKGPRGLQRGRYGLHFSASGGLAGSARDLATWLQALLADRAPASGLLRALGAPRTLADGRTTGYGLGLARSPLPGQFAIGHGGSLPGYKNHFLLLPEHGVGVVVVSNREDTDAHGITLAVAAALTGVRLAEGHSGLLPEGIFLAEDASCWIEHRAGVLTYLGAEEKLYPAEDGSAVSRSAHLPMHLRATGDAIAGEIGHAARRFHPAPGGDAAAAWAGHYVCGPEHASCDVTVANGAARLAIGVGPARVDIPLRVLSPTMALTDRDGAGPWRQRACLRFADGALHMATNRSRVLTFHRARSPSNG